MLCYSDGMRRAYSLTPATTREHDGAFVEVSGGPAEPANLAKPSPVEQPAVCFRVGWISCAFLRGKSYTRPKANPTALLNPLQTL